MKKFILIITALFITACEPESPNGVKLMKNGEYVVTQKRCHWTGQCIDVGISRHENLDDALEEKRALDQEFLKNTVQKTIE